MAKATSEDFLHAVGLTTPSSDDASGAPRAVQVALQYYLSIPMDFNPHLSNFDRVSGSQVIKLIKLSELSKLSKLIKLVKLI